MKCKNYNEDDREGILEDNHKNEYNGHFDTIDNEKAIIMIEESDKLNSLERMNLVPENKETDNNVLADKEEQIKPRKITNLPTKLCFDNY